MHKIVVVGSCMIDLVAYTNLLPLPGETIFGTQFVKNFGGKGGNQAIQCALLGQSVAFCGALGNDDFGHDYIANFMKNNVNIEHVLKSNGVSTGVALITVDEQGSNTIIVIPSANSLLSSQNIESANNFIASAIALICQNEVPLSTTLAAFRAAKQSNTLTIFNPAPAATLSELQEIIQLADIVCPNETELAKLTGLPTNSLEDIETAARRLLRDGKCGVVVVTLGDRGAMIVRRDACMPVPLPPGSRVIAIDTVGAGDSFIGSMTSHLVSGSPLSEAVFKAVQCAAISVTRKGAQVSFPSLSELPDNLMPKRCNAGGITLTESKADIHRNVFE